MKHQGLVLSLFMVLTCRCGLRAADPSAASSGGGGSVYRIVPAVDGPVLGLAAAGAMIPLFYESKLIHPHPPGDSHDINFIDRSVVGNQNSTVALMSHLTVALAIGIPAGIDLKDQGWNHVLAEDFVVYAEVLSLNTAVSNIARYGVQRPRPDVYAAGANVNDTGEYLSFYSGHVASTFAALSAASMTYGYRNGQTWWPWAVTFGVGIGEGFERSIAGRHYPTDNIAGAVVGTAIGIGVPWIHHRKSSVPLTLVPSANGAQVVWHKTF